MLSASGKCRYLECADCQSSFSSASSLLRHFAEHIIEKKTPEVLSDNAVVNVKLPEENETSVSCEEEKKGISESILETFLNQSIVQSICDSGPPIIQENSHHTNEPPLLKHLSEPTHKNIRSNDTKKGDDAPNKIVFEIGQRARKKMKSSTQTTLVKFDLQKRLENCVSRLARKQSCVESTNLNNSHECSYQYYQDDKANPETSDACSSCDDFNPLKFCVVSLEETKEKEVCKNWTEEVMNFRSLKGASSRKQLMPKKIHRPRAENVNIESCLPECPASERMSVAKRRYVCPVCSKAFGWSTDLKRHILTHTGERPFKCQRCAATFTRNFLLQKHQRRSHQGDIGAEEKPINVRLDKTQEMLNDKYSSKREKFAQDDASFELFPQKILNIL